MKKKKIYVFGHKNPDTDSIASAITYAYYKNLTDPDNEYIPFRLGNTNPETDFVLSYFGLEPPELLTDVYPKVEDVMVKNVITANYKDTLHSIGEIILSTGIRDLILIDDDGKLVGMITERRIARNFLKGFKDFTLKKYPLKVQDIIKVMDGKLLTGNINKKLQGRPMIAAMSSESIEKYLQEGDVLIVGDRENIHKMGILKKVECIIVTGGTPPSQKILDMARENDVVMILTPHVTYVAGRLLRLSSPAERIMEKKFLTLSPGNRLEEIEEDLMEDQNGVAVVVDDNMIVKGIITRHDLIEPPRKKVILVDHSEKSQTVKGIEKAEITEIVDHHRLGGLETEQPITTHIKPVGCTSTIIWELFKTQNITPPKSIMGAMLSAILSDTVLLRSPTTTQEDIMAVSEIGGELNLDVMEYGMKMYGAKSDLKGISISRMINMDRKEFHTSKGRIAVSQIEVVDSSSIIKRHEEILAEMEKTAEVRGYYLFALMITDILKESSDILACGETKLIEKAFHKKFEDHRIHLEGVVSRKKQVIPKILRYL